MNSKRLLCSTKTRVNVRIKTFWYEKLFSMKSTSPIDAHSQTLSLKDAYIHYYIYMHNIYIIYGIFIHFYICSDTKLCCDLILWVEIGLFL